MQNRILKFRAWDSKNKKWLTAVPSLEYLLDNEDACVSHHDYDEEDAVYTYPHNPLPYNFNGRIIYQQFTGLQDKNGAEIYEGDILLCKDDFASDQPEAKFKVIWDNDRWAFQMEGDTEGGHYWQEVNLDCLVIGNILDSPELLTEMDL